MHVGTTSLVVQGIATLATFGLLSGALHAQCNTTCPVGGFVTSDGCGDEVDSNGGCNVSPVTFDSVGVVAFGSPVTFCGSVGTYGATTRDLDWVQYTLASPATVRVTVNHLQGDGVTPAPNFVIFYSNGTDCNNLGLSGFVSGACPITFPEVVLPAGTHYIVATVNSFAPDGPACPVNYRATIEVVTEINAACGSGGNCADVTPGVGGCADLGCCGQVCDVFSLCCDSEWDAFCAELAIDICGLFIYECDSPGGAPANDCATAAIEADLNVEYIFNNTNAGTDGPTNEDCDQGKDIWYIVEVASAGELRVDVVSPDWDSTISFYALGNSTSFDPQTLPDLHIGCVDVAGDGGEIAFVETIGPEFFLVRIAGFLIEGVPDSGAGTVEFSFNTFIYNTGGTEPLLFNGTLTNLGFSSGNLGAGLEQRRSAMPFTIPDPGTGLIWRVQSIQAAGFTPAGVTNLELVYTIWERTSLQVPPTGSDVPVQSGTVPFPVPFDIPGAPANEGHEILVDFTLPAGDYWLTVYGQNTTPPSNFAWFVNAQNGINVINQDTGDAFQWRAATFPVPGFVPNAPANVVQADGLDPLDRFSCGFRILGFTEEDKNPPTPCPTDFNDDGVTDGADLGLLLANWGSAIAVYDLNDDGVVDGADLGLVLSVWGPCPE